MRFTTILSALSAVAAAVASNVIVADSSNFDDIVLNSGKSSFVKFYAEWCSHCQQMVPAWEHLAESYAKNDNVQIVEIDADKSKDIGKRYNIQGYPTLKLFCADALSDPVDYIGEREVEFFSNFLQNQIGAEGQKVKKPSKVVQIHDGNIEKFVENKNKAALILFTKEKDCEECDKAKDIFDELSHAFHKELDKVVIAEAQKNGDEPTDWIRELYHISEYPSMVFVEKGDINKFIVVQGFEVNGLIQFVNERIGTKRAVDGFLDPNAGIIPAMIEPLKKFIGMNIIDRREYVSDFIEELKKVDDNIYKNEIKYYALLVNQFIAGRNQYVDEELARLEKEIADKSIDVPGKDIINMKINLLKFVQTLVTPETYKDSEQILAERAELEANATDSNDETTTKDSLAKDEL